MGVTYRPDDVKRRRMIERALVDLDPSLREPVKKLVENYKGEDLERKLTELVGFEKLKDLIEKKR
jgi:hypothetical protein